MPRPPREVRTRQVIEFDADITRLSKKNQQVANEFRELEKKISRRTRASSRADDAGVREAAALGFERQLLKDGIDPRTALLLGNASRRFGGASDKVLGGIFDQTKLTQAARAQAVLNRSVQQSINILQAKNKTLRANAGRIKTLAELTEKLTSADLRGKGVDAQRAASLAREKRAYEEQTSAIRRNIRAKEKAAGLRLQAAGILSGLRADRSDLSELLAGNISPDEVVRRKRVRALGRKGFLPDEAEGIAGEEATIRAQKAALAEQKQKLAVDKTIASLQAKKQALVTLGATTRTNTELNNLMAASQLAEKGATESQIDSVRRLKNEIAALTAAQQRRIARVAERAETRTRARKDFRDLAVEAGIIQDVINKKGTLADVEQRLERRRLERLGLTEREIKARETYNKTIENGRKRLEALNNTVGRHHTFLKSIVETFGRVAILSAGFGAFFALVNGLRAATAAGIQFNAALENVRLGVAATLGATTQLVDELGRVADPATSLRISLSEADEAVRLFREDAIDLGVDLEVLVDIFPIIAGSASSVGIALKDQVALTEQLVTLGSKLGLSQTQLKRTVDNIFRGYRVQSNELGNILGLTTDLVKSWKSQGIFVEELNKRLIGVQSVLDNNLSTYDGIRTSIKSILGELSGKLFGQAFDILKGKLKEIRLVLLLFLRDQQRIENLAYGINSGFEAVLETLQRIIAAAPKILGILNTGIRFLELSLNVVDFLTDSKKGFGSASDLEQSTRLARLIREGKARFNEDGTLTVIRDTSRGKRETTIPLPGFPTPELERGAATRTKQLIEGLRKADRKAGVVTLRNGDTLSISDAITEATSNIDRLSARDPRLGLRLEDRLSETTRKLFRRNPIAEDDGTGGDSDKLSDLTNRLSKLRIEILDQEKDLLISSLELTNKQFELAKQLENRATDLKLQREKDRANINLRETQRTGRQIDIIEAEKAVTAIEERQLLLEAKAARDRISVLERKLNTLDVQRNENLDVYFKAQEEVERRRNKASSLTDPQDIERNKVAILDAIKKVNQLALEEDKIYTEVLQTQTEITDTELERENALERINILWEDQIQRIKEARGVVIDLGSDISDALINVLDTGDFQGGLQSLGKTLGKQFIEPFIKETLDQKVGKLDVGFKKNLLGFIPGLGKESGDQTGENFTKSIFGSIKRESRPGAGNAPPSSGGGRVGGGAGGNLQSFAQSFFSNQSIVSSAGGFIPGVGAGGTAASPAQAFFSNQSIVSSVGAGGGGIGGAGTATSGGLGGAGGLGAGAATGGIALAVIASINGFLAAVDKFNELKKQTGDLVDGRLRIIGEREFAEKSTEAAFRGFFDTIGLGSLGGALGKVIGKQKGVNASTALIAGIFGSPAAGIIAGKLGIDFGLFQTPTVESQLARGLRKIANDARIPQAGFKIGKKGRNKGFGIGLAAASPTRDIQRAFEALGFEDVDLLKGDVDRGNILLGRAPGNAFGTKDTLGKLTEATAAFTGVFPGATGIDNRRSERRTDRLAALLQGPQSDRLNELRFSEALALGAFLSEDVNRDAAKTSNIIISNFAQLEFSAEETEYQIKRLAQASGVDLVVALGHLSEKFRQGEITLKAYQTLVGGTIDLLDLVPESVDGVAIAEAASGLNNIVESGKLERVIQQVQNGVESVATGLQEALETGDLTQAAYDLAERFAQSFTDTLFEELVTKSAIGAIFEEASILAAQAIDKFVAGDIAGGRNLLAQAGKKVRSGQDTFFQFGGDFLPEIAAFLNSLGVYSGGFLNPTGSGLPSLDTPNMTTVPGLPGKPTLAIMHGQERVYNPDYHDNLSRSVSALASSVANMRNSGGNVKVNVYLDGKEIGKEVRVIIEGNKDKINLPQASIGA